MSAPANRVAPWEDVVLRAIAIWKLSHAILFSAAGFGLLQLRHHNVVEVLNHYVIIPYHLNPEDRLVDWLLAQAEKVSPHMLVLAGWAAFFYAALFFAEGIGLYLRKHWAEYLVVIVTGSLLPLEIYELWIKVAWWKWAAVIGNLLILGYLIHRILLDRRTKAQADQGKAESTEAPAVARAKPVANEVP